MRLDMNHCRHGVTLIEVVFAIGVILIGLLGLLSILPLAGNRAQDAISLNEGAALADSIANQIQASNLVSDNFVASDGTAVTLRQTPASGNTFILPFCIDPLLCAANIAASESYDVNFFPFYDQNHDPTLDPSISTSNDSTDFTLLPRFLRVQPSRFASLTAPQKLEAARTISESVDDLSPFRPKDRSKNLHLSGVEGTSGSAIDFGKFLPSGEYTWIATVDPTFDSRFATMSVVVMRDRERLNGFPGPNQTSARGNALAERIALVTEFSGFRGGGGGMVELTSAVNTLSSLSSGDWLMLSRNVDPTIADDERSRNEVHRWYRILAVAGDAEIIIPASDTDIDGVTIPLPASGVTRSDPSKVNAVWQRKVILDGSDWNFGVTPFVANNKSNNSLTYATICDDVVAASERTISLADF